MMEPGNDSAARRLGDRPAVTKTLLSVTPDMELPTVPHCGQCGYDLRGLPSPRCPECGFDNSMDALRAAAEAWFVSWRGLFGVRMPPFGVNLIDSTTCSVVAAQRPLIWFYGPWIVCTLSYVAMARAASSFSSLLSAAFPILVVVCIFLSTRWAGRLTLAEIAFADYEWSDDKRARRAAKNASALIDPVNGIAMFALALNALLGLMLGFTRVKTWLIGGLEIALGVAVLHPILLCVRLAPRRLGTGHAGWVSLVATVACLYGVYLVAGFMVAVLLLLVPVVGGVALLFAGQS